MEKFIRIIISENNSIPNDIHYQISNLLDPLLIETKPNMGLTSNNKLVIHYKMNAHLDDHNADKYASEIFEILSKNNINEYDIEMSTGKLLFEDSTNDEPEKIEPEPFDLFNKTDYDVVNDLIVFMRNDFQFYRRHYYPAIHKASKYYQKTQKIDIKKFIEPVIKYGVMEYCKKYDTPEEPDELFGQEEINEVINRICKQETPQIKKGEY